MAETTGAETASGSSKAAVRTLRDLDYAPTASAAAVGTGAPTRGSRTLDLYLAQQPAKADVDVTRASEAPLLVFIHGGLWVDRDKAGFATLGAHWATELRAHVAVVNYRLSSSGEAAAAPDAVLHPAHTDDVLLALRWLCSAEAQKAHGFRASELVLVGHSCGAHIAGLIALAEPEATMTQARDDENMAQMVRMLRGCVGIEGIFDCARFAADFPDWASGITDAFGPDPARWESPQDYLPLSTQMQAKGSAAAPAAATPSSADSSLSRQRVQQALADKPMAQRRRRVPWLVIHSPDDPWVNMPQAERFHAAVLADAEAATAAASSSNAVASASAAASGTDLPQSASSAASSTPSSRLSLVRGAHFEVVERIGTSAQDEVTPLLREFVRRCCAPAASASSASS